MNDNQLTNLEITDRTWKRLIWEVEYQTSTGWTKSGNIICLPDSDVYPEYPFALVKIKYLKYNCTRIITINWRGNPYVNEIVE